MLPRRLTFTARRRGYCLALGPFLFQSGPVLGSGDLRPGLISVLLTLGEVMAVGGFLDGSVEPDGGVRIVRPGLHAAQEVILVGGAAEHVVHERRSLRTGDVVFGLEAAVVVAVDDAELGCVVDILSCPGGRDVGIRVAVVGLRGLVIEAGRDGRELCAGDRCVRLESLVGVTGNDACVREGADRVVVPCGGVNVGQIAALLEDLLARVVGEQAIEDGRDFGSGDVAGRADRAVSIAVDIGEVVGLVEDRCAAQRGAGLFDGGAAAGAAATAA